MKKNIVLLSVDALRADHLTCYGYGERTTPNIDTLASNSLHFENAYSTSSHTREAVPSILTGRHPTNAIVEDFSLDSETIATSVADTHISGAFHSNPYVSRAYGFDTDFDKFYDDMYLGRSRLFALAQRALDRFVFNRGEYHARAEEINRRSLDWIDSLDDENPFFLWNHYMDVHGPYNPPFESSRISKVDAQRLYDRLAKGAPSKEDVRLAKNLYDGEIRYVDAWIGQFLDQLRKRDLFEQSLIVLTADHGDLFGEHGRYAHPRFVYPELTRVPMIVSTPNVAPNVINNVVSTLDIFPTMLDFLDKSSETLPGESLLSFDDSRRNEFAFSSATGENEREGLRQFAIYNITRGYRMTRELGSGDIVSETAIRLPDGDVVDAESLSEPDREAYESLRRILLKHSDEQLGTRFQKKDGASTGDTIEKRLEALGYK
ncbi:sulfatase [Halocatena pleomorpha]|uniref:Arylsulfatase n=1 Tax=Halocatena pleomorpha TaxID=1785090 RepID=A0A3P3R8W5_9EURY|nr:sulfatase [Halocatena pleomorpha]RRJ29478.1 arylsulfatase [Halocatena pleomorpha]